MISLKKNTLLKLGIKGIKYIQVYFIKKLKMENKNKKWSVVQHLLVKFKGSVCKRN